MCVCVLYVCVCVSCMRECVLYVCPYMCFLNSCDFPYMCPYMCPCMCPCMCACTYTRRETHTCMCPCMCACTDTHTHTHTLTHSHTHGAAQQLADRLRSRSMLDALAADAPYQSGTQLSFPNGLTNSPSSYLDASQASTSVPIRRPRLDA